MNSAMLMEVSGQPDPTHNSIGTRKAAYHAVVSSVAAFISHHQPLVSGRQRVSIDTEFVVVTSPFRTSYCRLQPE